MAPRRRIVSLSLVLVLALATWTGPASGQSPSAPVETRDPEVISVVGLGDSFAGGQIGCSGECRPFVQVYGDLVSEALDRPVEVTNLATSDSLESGGLLQRVTRDAAHREALAGADVITVMIGWNDWQGPCFWEGWDDCFARTQPAVEANVTAILDEISLLREGKPTVLRVVTYYDPYVGWSASPGVWGFDPAETATFEARFSEELTAVQRHALFGSGVAWRAVRRHPHADQRAEAGTSRPSRSPPTVRSSWAGMIISTR